MTSKDVQRLSLPLSRRLEGQPGELSALVPTEKGVLAQFTATSSLAYYRSDGREYSETVLNCSFPPSATVAVHFPFVASLHIVSDEEVLRVFDLEKQIQVTTKLTRKANALYTNEKGIFALSATSVEHFSSYSSIKKDCQMIDLESELPFEPAKRSVVKQNMALLIYSSRYLLLDMSTGLFMVPLRSLNQAVRAADFSDRFAALTTGESVTVIDMYEPTESHTFPVDAPVTTLVFSDRDKLVLGDECGRLLLFDCLNRNLVCTANPAENDATAYYAFDAVASLLIDRDRIFAIYTYGALVAKVSSSSIEPLTVASFDDSYPAFAKVRGASLEVILAVPGATVDQVLIWTPDVSKKSKRVSILKKFRLSRLSALSKLRGQLDPASSPVLSVTADFALHFSEHLIRKSSSGRTTSRRPLTARSQTYSEPLKSPHKSTSKSSGRRKTKGKNEFSLQLGAASMSISSLSSSSAPVLERADVASAVVELGQSIIARMQGVHIELVTEKRNLSLSSPIFGRSYNSMGNLPTIEDETAEEAVLRNDILVASKMQKRMSDKRKRSQSELMRAKRRSIGHLGFLQGRGAGGQEGSGGDVPLEVKKVEELDKAQRRIHNQQSELKLQTVLLAQQQNEISELKKRLRDSGLHAPDDERSSPTLSLKTASEASSFDTDSPRSEVDMQTRSRQSSGGSQRGRLGESSLEKRQRRLSFRSATVRK